MKSCKVRKKNLSLFLFLACLLLCCSLVRDVLDGKYHLLPNGDLLIHNLEYNDKFASYRCRTMHKLSRLVVISNPSKIAFHGELLYLFFLSFLLS